MKGPLPVLLKAQGRRKKMSEKKKLSYSKAIRELEQIINEIETETIDVDLLTEKVKRASALITFCKGNLKTTEEEVKKALSEIEAKPGEEVAGDPEQNIGEPF
jgi:exodeoxyribonuclease VII small subunit